MRCCAVLQFAGVAGAVTAGAELSAVLSTAVTLTMLCCAVLRGAVLRCAGVAGAVTAGSGSVAVTGTRHAAGAEAGAAAGRQPSKVSVG
jgi:hypothetical protein